MKVNLLIPLKFCTGQNAFLNKIMKSAPFGNAFEKKKKLQFEKVKKSAFSNHKELHFKKRTILKVEPGFYQKQLNFY
jgi:hypothetical protein